MNILISVLETSLHLLFVFNILILLELILNGKKIRRISCVLVFPYLVSVLLNTYPGITYIGGIINVFLMYVLLFAITMTAFKGSKLTITYVTLMFLLADSILSPFCLLVIQTFGFEFNSTVFIKSFSLGVNILLFSVLFSSKKRKITEGGNAFSLIPKKMYILIGISAMLMSLMVGFASYEYTPDHTYRSVMSVLIILLIIIMLVLISYTVIYCLSNFYYERMANLLNKQIDNQLQHYATYNRMNRQLAEFRHDHKNHMICLSTFIKKNMNKEALEYLESINNRVADSMNAYSSGNLIADAILNEKNSIAEQEGYSISFSGAISNSISAFDLCTILSNALDNSVEACRNCRDHSNLHISVDCQIKNNVQFICIRNSSDTTDKKLRTTHKDKFLHGYGMYNIRKTVENLNGDISVSSLSPEFILNIEFLLAPKK